MYDQKPLKVFETIYIFEGSETVNFFIAANSNNAAPPFHIEI